MNEALRLLFARDRRGPIVVLFGLIALNSLTEGFGLVLLVPLVASVSGADIPAPLLAALPFLGQRPPLGLLLAAFVALVVVRTLIQNARVLRGQAEGYHFANSFRLRALSLLFGAEWRAMSGMGRAEAETVVLSHADRIHFALESLLTGFATAATLAVSGAVALVLSPRTALVTLAAGVVVLLAYAGLRRRAYARGEAVTGAYGLLYGLVNEALGALRLVKSMGAEARAEGEIRHAILSQQAAELTYQRETQYGRGALQVVASAALALAVWVAVSGFGLGASVLLPLIAVFARALPLIGSLQDSWQNWLHALPALRETQALIARLEGAQEPPAQPGLAAPAFARELVVEAIRLTHHGRDAPALDGVSLRLAAGSLTALVGPSGAGKSTLADVLGGLVAADAGTFMVDGVAIAGPVRRAWRGRVAYVHQEALLFHTTIRENFRWAAPASSEAAMAAALRAASAGFVLDLPEGLDTVVGDRGSRLSGGERQRVALARALVGDPALLILDESTSALDSASEAAVCAALAALKGRVTMLVIAHRGALTGLADRIVTLHEGRIVEDQAKP